MLFKLNVYPFSEKHQYRLFYLTFNALHVSEFEQNKIWPNHVAIITTEWSWTTIRTYQNDLLSAIRKDNRTSITIFFSLWSFLPFSVKKKPACPFVNRESIVQRECGFLFRAIFDKMKWRTSFANYEKIGFVSFEAWELVIVVVSILWDLHLLTFFSSNSYGEVVRLPRAKKFWRVSTNLRI